MSNKKHEAKRSKHYRIIGVDGEGYFNTQSKTHIYDVLTVGDATIASHYHISIFEFMDLVFSVKHSVIAKGQIPIFVGYFFNYDATQLVRNLDSFFIESLANSGNRRITLPKPDNYPKYKRAPSITKPVNVLPNSLEDEVRHIDNGARFSKRRFKIDYVKSKYLEIKRPIESSLHKARAKQDESKIEWDTVKIQDIGTIYGSSFEKAVKAFDVEISDSESKELAAGKANRSNNLTKAERREQLDEIISYNKLEMKLTGRLVKKTVEALTHKDIGYIPDLEKELSGLGSLAGGILKKQAKHFNLLKSYEIAAIVGADAYKMANDSYYGGWFETFRFGLHENGMYQYDITSAYPHVMRNLPDLSDAIVSDTITDYHSLCNAIDDFNAIVYVDVDFIGSNDKLGALPFRAKNGSVIRPVSGNGTYLLEEVRAADKAGLLEKFYINKAITIFPQSDRLPFAWLEEVFNRRLKVGKKTVVGLMLKLIINSQYGKITQSIGNPEYANPIYASIITARTRIMLLDAIRTHSNGIDSLIATATDAVFFDTPHTALDMAENKLGAWEEDYYERGWTLKPGIWSGGKEADPYESFDMKTRGISYKSVRAKIDSHIIPAFERMRDNKQWDNDYAFNTGNSFSMVSIGQAVSWGQPEKAGEFITGDHGLPEVLRELKFDIAPKRRDIEYIDGKGFESKAPIIVDTDNPFGLPESKKFEKVIGNVDFS